MAAEAPTKRITSPVDLEKWTSSSTYDLIVDFVVDLQHLVIGKANDTEITTPENGKLLLEALDRVDSIIEANPVVADKEISRFGKIEFRQFYDQVAQESSQFLQPLVPEANLPEISAYFNESWGNRTRIDYGSGHELNFVCFLFCLYKVKVFTKDDFTFLIVKAFNKYMKIMRRLQITYWLEPAGSHGVWGLDDYHFLPFLFGAAQLATHEHMKPKLIHNDELVEMYHSKYMYFECIHFINNIKTVPNQDQKLSLRWHSPMLDDILAAKSWQKITEGMIKMYKAEVLGKLPIMQHFMFGSLIQCPDGINLHAHDEAESECGHLHQNTWGDCCGIKIPSAIAASESLRSQTQHKPVPFD